MAKKTPYEVLDVDPQADEETVKKAYRKKAKESHPDSGGTKEDFQEVNKAWMILSDPQRRKRWDEKGDDSTEPDNAESEAIGVVSVAYKQVVLHNIEKEAENVDLTGAMLMMLKEAVEKPKADLGTIKKAIRFIQASVKRMRSKKGKKGNPMLLQLANQQLKEARDNETFLKKRLEVLARAKEIVEGIDYDWVKMEPKNMGDEILEEMKKRLGGGVEP